MSKYAHTLFENAGNFGKVKKEGVGYRTICKFLLWGTLLQNVFNDVNARSARTYRIALLSGTVE
ncbi:MAG: hypothetical protein FJ117_00890 [Deltaproteobacteria bacterium]|nr:hypothetical protein [Deltaproteobacteria bacterium]